MSYSKESEIVLNYVFYVVKKLKNASQDVEAKIKTEEDHAQGKPSSETLNKAKVKVRNAL